MAPGRKKKPNSDPALAEIRSLAKMGVPEAQHTLGCHYYYGEGVRKNYKTACKWIKLAAEQGLATSQYSMFSFYRQGAGVPKNTRID